MTTDQIQKPKISREGNIEIMDSTPCQGCLTASFSLQVAVLRTPRNSECLLFTAKKTSTPSVCALLPPPVLSLSLRCYNSSIGAYITSSVSGSQSSVDLFFDSGWPSPSPFSFVESKTSVTQFGLSTSLTLISG